MPTDTYFSLPTMESLNERKSEARSGKAEKF